MPESAVSKPERTAYLGARYDLVQIYVVDGQRLGFSLQYRNAKPLDQFVCMLVTPEEYRQRVEARFLESSGATTTSLPDYDHFDLPVPIRSMYDECIPAEQREGYKNCGPTSGAMVDELYAIYRDYPYFHNWCDDHIQLYVYMETNQHSCFLGFPPGGTCPDKAESGWKFYAASRGYHYFDGLYEGDLTNWSPVVQSIELFEPLMASYINVSQWTFHWEVVVGFETIPAARYHLNDATGGQHWIDCNTEGPSYHPLYFWPTNRVVSGAVRLQGSLRPAAGKEVPLDLRIFDPGATWDDWFNHTELDICTLKTMNNQVYQVGFGSDTLSGVNAGTYDVAMKSPHTLVNIRRNVYIGDSGWRTGTKIDMGTLLEGNCDDDQCITDPDYAILYATYQKRCGQPGFDARADFDYTCIVNIVDFTMMASNWQKCSPIEVGQGAGAGGTGGTSGLETLGLVNLSLGMPAQGVSANRTFSVTITVDAGAQPVAGVDAFLNFNPQYLQVMSITGGTTLPEMLCNRFDNTRGTIDFSAGKLGDSTPSGTFTLATVELRAKAQTEGTSLTFAQTDERNTVAAYQGNSVLGSLTGATVVIQP